MKSAKEWSAEYPELDDRDAVEAFVRMGQADALEAAALALESRVTEHLSDDTPETWQCVKTVRKLKPEAR